MAHIVPFRALRYDPQRVAPASVVTQPYDKITPQAQERYYASSPYNLVRLILGKPEPSDSKDANVYTRAAGFFGEWRRQGIFLQDPQPSIYVYSQRFVIPGTRSAAGSLLLAGSKTTPPGSCFVTNKPWPNRRLTVCNSSRPPAPISAKFSCFTTMPGR